MGYDTSYDYRIEIADQAVKELECALIRLKSVRKRKNMRLADNNDYEVAKSHVVRATELLR